MIQEKVNALIGSHPNVKKDISREEMIKAAVKAKEVLVGASGAIVTWTPPESTGRSPKDTVTVKRAESQGFIDWDSPYNLPITEETFHMLLEDALSFLSQKESLYVVPRVVGADSGYALPVTTITDRALTSLFVDNMFRPVPRDIDKSIFAKTPFTLLVVPYEKLDPKRYEGKLRKLANGKTTDMAIAIDYDRYCGVVIGSAYCGSVKKLMFTVMNYLLPPRGILPLHASANEGKDGSTALLLGLSGTGKTTLSADPRRALLGDDEHGWNDTGIANFENGCYAKLIHLRKDKEPEIHNAIMHQAPMEKHGAIVENCMMFPDGHFDFDDGRLTENSRASYPLSFLSNIKPSAVGGHPTAILFLTADANGVLPPVAKLTDEQAMLWFLMGYTSKLAGTETGIVEPVTTFSRFFGAPFMPRNPGDYADMLGTKIRSSNAGVYLVNTGWSGGPYGEGSRMDINMTRAMVEAALSGDLEKVEYKEDPLFHILVPQSCPNVPCEILNPKNTWKDKQKFDERAAKLAKEFSAAFDKAYGNKNIDPRIVAVCPGK